MSTATTDLPEDWQAILDRHDPELLDHPEGRRLLTRDDPQLFAILYLPHHLKDDAGVISFSPMHLDWYQHALAWREPVTQPRAARDSYIAPRNSAKTTMWFLLLPMWAAAHGHKSFIAAFSDAGTQAELHLTTFRQELRANQLLRQDFPQLCDLTVSHRGQLIAASGFAFTARGIDSASLGLKVGEHRPDLLLVDDCEPHEGDYSLYQMTQRRSALIDAVLPMNERAHVVIVGTVTMDGSIIHQLVKTVTAPAEEHEAWIADEKIRVHYYEPIITDADGSQRSIWPNMWPLDYLLGISGTRSYAKNFANQPVSEDGMWWRAEDIRYGGHTRFDRVVLMVDGAVTTKTTSDYTGLAVVGLHVASRSFTVLEAMQVKLAGEDLRLKAIDLVVAHDVSYILVESNQGGDLWYLVFHDMPCRTTTFPHSEPKPVRIKRLLAVYQRAAVWHAKTLPALEKQQRAYPDVLHEDVLDATAAAVHHLIHMLLRTVRKSGTRTEVRKFSYMG